MTKEELIKFLSDCYDQWAKDGFGDAGAEYHNWSFVEPKQKTITVYS